MELADDDIVVPSAMMGAPTVMVEKIPRGEEIVSAFKALETYLGRTGARHDVVRGGRAQLDDARSPSPPSWAFRSSTPT